MLILVIKRKYFWCTLVIALLIVAGLWTGLRAFLHLSYPQKYSEQVFAIAAEYQIDPYLVFSVIKSESGFNPDARSHKDAVGLMQITPATGAWIAEKMALSEFDLSLPQTNIRFGCWYLAYLLETFDYDLTVSLASYNGGSGNVRQWLSDTQYSPDGKTLLEIPFRETRHYVGRVLHNYKMYRKLYT